MNRGSTLKRFWADESGATAIEYCFLMMLIALVSIFGMRQVGLWLPEPFENATDGLS